MTRSKTCMTCTTEFESDQAFQFHRSSECEAKVKADFRNAQLPMQKVCGYCGKTVTKVMRHMVRNHRNMNRRHGVIQNMCPLCERSASDINGLAKHIAARHACCPTCDEYFETRLERDQHQKETGHCYCEEHDACFPWKRTFALHKRCAAHNGFECIDCKMAFNSERALDAHFTSAEHEAATMRAQDRTQRTTKACWTTSNGQEISTECQMCHRVPKDPHGCREHIRSCRRRGVGMGHALSELRCPMSDQCRKTYKSPSAVLAHLESGGCKGGVDRQTLNTLIHQYDHGQQITKAGNLAKLTAESEQKQLVLKAATSTSDATQSLGYRKTGALNISQRSGSLLSIAGNQYKRNLDDNEGITSQDGGVELVHLSPISRAASFDGGVQLVPLSSLGHTPSFDGGVSILPVNLGQTASEWSFLDVEAELRSPDSSAAFANAVVPAQKVEHVWHCKMPGCTRTFQSETALRQHLNSPAHSPKLFYCPKDMGLPKQKSRKGFKSLSGLAKHIEDGACAGGMETLKKICGVFEAKIAEFTGISVKLLLGGATGG